MRQHWIVLPLIGLLALPGHADPVRYEQIPADVVSYFHIDVDRLLASRMSQIEINGTTVRQNLGVPTPSFQRGIAGSIMSGTMYLGGREGKPVMLLHASAQKFHEDVEAPRSKDTTVFTYDGQEVHYSSSCLIPEVFGKPVKNESTPPSSPGSLGIGLAGNDYRKSWNGSFYTAYVGRDLIVMALDLPVMAEALDVLNSKKPSLAKEDPHGLKMQPPPGAIFIGAGLSAGWTGGNLGGSDNLPDNKSTGTTRPVRVADSDFGLNLFGSFEGKARLARLDMGENEQSEYADATFTMVDADSAAQLKNLLLGIKALASLSQAQEKPFIDPLDVATNQNDVVLHWSLPAAKLSELVRQMAGPPAHDSSLSTNIPASQPAR